MSAPIVEKKKGISSVWILPLLALCVGGWLVYKSHLDAGINITLRVDTAAGITIGKTPVVFKGAHVGLVKKMTSTSDLQGMILTIEMNKKAAPYLIEDAAFWIETIEVEAGRLTGLDTLLSGSYIGMRLGKSEQPSRSYVALPRRPPMADTAPGLHLNLQSDALYSVQVGSGIYHKNVVIGSVQSYELKDNDTVAIKLYIKPEYASLIKKSSRFWNASGITVTGGISDLKIHMASLAAIIKGGITVETPVALKNDAPAENGQVFKMYEDFDAAEYGIPLTLELYTAEGIHEGSTKVVYRGMELGHVQQININDNQAHTVTATVLLDPRAEIILNSGTQFYLVKPEFSLKGVRNIDTVITGTYITFTPGEGEKQYHFVVQSGEPENVFAREHSDGLFINLVADDLGSVSVGSPILYKKVTVGEITAVRLRENEDDILITGLVKRQYAGLIKDSSRFYNTSGVEVTANLGTGLKVQTGTLETLIAGGVSFFNPVKGKSAQQDSRYSLFEDFAAANHSDREKIVIHFSETNGLKEGVTIKYNGIDVGKISHLSYEKKMTRVRAEAVLDKEAVDLLRTGTRFWLVRPEFSLAGTQNLDTLISGPYINLDPGGGPLATEFTAINEIVAQTADGGGFEIVLEADDLFSLKAGSPIYYRRVKVGQVLNFELSPTFQKVYLQAIIFESYQSIIRENTKFWNASGIHVKGGVLSGLSVSTESLDALMTGGIALATPDNDDMGAPVKPGHHFTLYEESEDSWGKWSPEIFKPSKEESDNVQNHMN